MQSSPFHFLTTLEPIIGAPVLPRIYSTENDLRTLLNKIYATKFLCPEILSAEEIGHKLPMLVRCNANMPFDEFIILANVVGAELRNSTAWAMPIGHVFAIKHPEITRALIVFQQNWNTARAWKSDIATFLWRYILCLWCHIFVDFNGRLARIFLAEAIFTCASLSNIDFACCYYIARCIHAKIKNQLIVMESQNSRCWLCGTLELVSTIVSQQIASQILT